MKYKICTKCTKRRLITDFYFRDKSRGKRSSNCKFCVSSNKDPEKVKKNSRTWRERHKEEIKLTHRNNPKLSMFRDAKKRARRKDLDFSIELSDIIIPDKCPVFGTTFSIGDGKHTDASPSLDRIDNTKGYVKGNVWVISWRANHLKSDASITELETLLHHWRQRLES